MGWIGALLGGIIGGYLVTRYLKQPIIVAIVIGIIAVLGYTMIPW